MVEDFALNTYHWGLPASKLFPLPAKISCGNGDLKPSMPFKSDSLEAEPKTEKIMNHDMLREDSQEKHLRQENRI